ncbi:MAG: DUF4332 domain-containing protein [Cyanobacteria bacterium J06635_15]
MTLPAIMQSQYWPIQQIPGISRPQLNQLAKFGVTTTSELLHYCQQPNQRRQLSQSLSISIRDINKWIAMSDLARIPNVGWQYCGLLLHAGIGSVSQLATMPVQQVHKQIQRLQVQHLQRADLCPNRGQVAEWIQSAQRLR